MLLSLFYQNRKTMTTTKLKELAKDSLLDYVETTSERNGYPSNIRGAITGFSDFSEALDFAAEHDMELTYIEKRDGWQLWYRTNNTAYEAIKANPEDFGANMSGIYPGTYEDEWDFFEREVKERLRNCCDFEDAAMLLKEYGNIWGAVSQMNDTQIVLHEGLYYRDTIDAETCHYYYDNKHIAIAALKK